MQEDTDRYGRLVGHVYVGSTHVNRKLVQDGIAWVYRQYSRDAALLQNWSLTVQQLAIKFGNRLLLDLPTGPTGN